MTKYAGRDLVIKAGTRQTLTAGVAATDLLTAPTHGLVADSKVVFTSLTGGTGLLTFKEYFVLASGLTANDFKVSLTSGGAAVDFSTNLTTPFGQFYKLSTVGAATGIGPTGSSRDLIDASAYGDAFKDYVVGQQDGAELELSVAYDPADTTHQLLKTLYDAGVTADFLMTHTTATGFKVAFPGLITKLERGGERDGLLAMMLSVKVLSPGVTDVT